MRMCVCVSKTRLSPSLYQASVIECSALKMGAKRFRQFLVYTGCPRRNVKYFGRVFLMLNYTDITQNTYIQS